MFPRWLVWSGMLGLLATAHAHPSLGRYPDHTTEPQSPNYHEFLSLDNAGTYTLDTAKNSKIAERGLEPRDWRSLSCPEDLFLLVWKDPAQAWRDLGGDEAWSEMVTAWKKRNGSSGENISFLNFVGQFFGLSECGPWGYPDDCPITRCEWYEETNGTGPAGYAITRSVQQIVWWLEKQRWAVREKTPFLYGLRRRLETAFGKNEGFDEELVEFISEQKTMAIGLAMGMAPAFYNLTSKGTSETATHDAENGLKYLLSIGGVMSNETKPVLGGPTTYSKDYISLVLAAVTENLKQAIVGLERGIFGGYGASIELLSYMVADGKMWGIKDRDINDTATEYSWQVAKHGIIISHMWRLNNITPVILDTGAACTDKGVGVGDYIWSMNVANASGCVDGKLYYLVSPEGRPKSYDAGIWLDRKFSALKGVDKIVAGWWPGVTVQDMITSAVTFSKKLGNRKSYNDLPEDGSFSDTWEDLFEAVKSDRRSQGAMVSAPGVIDIPVCSPEEAWKNWLHHHGDKTPRYYQYPCNKEE